MKTGLENDPIMAKLMQTHRLRDLGPVTTNPFLDLAETIVSQQLSVKAADTIFQRFLALFKTSPTPKAVLEVPIETLRTVGLSNSKAHYLHHLSEAVESGALEVSKFSALSDLDIKNEIVKVKGLGPWSAEMFLIFSLKRPDVFSLGDLGLRTAIEKLYGIKRDNLKKIAKLSERWQPNRSLASRLLWASLDNS